MVSSATAGALRPGALVTGMPRWLAAATSTFTGPPRAQHTSRSGAASSTSALTGAPCTSSASWPATAATRSAGSPTYSRSARSEAVRGAAASVAPICSSVTDTASPRPASAAEKTLAGMYPSPTTRTRTVTGTRRSV